MGDPMTLIPEGAALLGAAVGCDFLGVGAGLFTLLRDVAVKDDEAWRKQLTRLARRGWDDAEKARTEVDRDAYPLPNRDACVDYVMTCVYTGAAPTADGLMRHRGSGLMRHRGSGLDVPADPTCEWGARVFLEHMIRAMLEDRSFAVYRLLSVQLQTLARDAAVRDAQLAALTNVVRELNAAASTSAIVTAINLLTDPALRPSERPAQRRRLPDAAVRPGDDVLDYLSGAVKFCGRDAEVDDLVAFCEEDADSWTWQAVTGQGGTGKSRLAFELCQRMRERGWEAYFLNQTAFDHTPPAALASCPADMLFVIDYVAFAAKRVGRWLAGLPRTSAHRVRVLLLEREDWRGDSLDLGQPIWFRDLGQAFVSGDLGQHLGRVAGDGPVLSLTGKPLAEGTMVEIIQSIGAPDDTAEADGAPADDVGARDAGSLIPRLIAGDIVTQLRQRIDPSAKRPLYLLFLAQAYLDDPADSAWRTWDLHEIHRVLYERERKRLVGTFETFGPGAASVALDLWAFATATRAPLADAFSDAPAWLVVDAPAARGEFRRRLRGCVGTPDADIVPYTPDIPGEYLVAACLADWTDADRVTRFTHDCWQASPRSFADFLARLVSDLGDTAPPEFEPVLGDNGLFAEPSSKEDFHVLATTVGGIIVPERVTARAAGLVIGWANQHLDDDLLVRLGIRAAVATSQPTKGMRPPVDPMAVLRNALPDVDEQSLTSVTEPAYNVITKVTGSLLTRGMPQGFLDELSRIHDSGDLSAAQAWVGSHRPDYPSVVAAAVGAVMGALASIHHKLPLMPLQQTCANLNTHIWLSPSFSEQRRSEAHAVALFNLTWKSGDVAEVRRACDEIGVLATNHRDNPDIALQWAKALVNLTVESGDAAEVRWACDEVGVLAADHPDNLDIALQRAMALVNLTVKSGDAAEVRWACDEVGVVAADHPGNPDIALRWAIALVNLTSKSGDAAEVRWACDEVGVVVADHPGDPDIALRWAMALVNLTGKCDEGEEAERAIDELQVAVNQAPVPQAQPWLLAGLDEACTDEWDGPVLQKARDSAIQVLGADDPLTITLATAYEHWGS
jgi:hypothetical protein